MTTIKVNSKGKITKLEVKEGAILMFELFKAQFDVYSPCGGNGTCGKCKVYIKNEGYVTSCLYRVEKDIEISLPDHAEASILISQYKFTRQLPFNPGSAINLSSYPMGIAIDIGTTSIVLHLINLITGALQETRAVLNPQVKFGADVITRISYCIEKEYGLEEIQRETIQVLNQQIQELARATDITTSEIVKITISGNTTMLHMLLGEDPSSLAYVPFKAVFLDQKTIKANEFGFDCNTEAEIIILPSASAYVGADIVCGLASLAEKKEILNFLYIDIGTNGEMALVKDDKIYACATAAGPAFEGANINYGMPALEGAITSFDKGNYKTIGDIKPKGICGSGLIDIIAYLVKSSIIKADGEMDSEYVVYNDKKTKVSINQNDIRELQLAKSAIMTGIKILMKTANVKEKDIDAVYLAGGFGNYINIESAAQIGLLPSNLKSKVIPIGNASGTGAILALKSENFYGILQSLREKTKNIELSEHEEFAMEFAMNMGFDTSSEA